jgi:hypothetical protein
MKIHNTFSRGPEGWCSYDYHASMVDDGVNVFVLTTWAEAGGVGDSGYIWTNHRRWSADTPEQPLSILPLLFYRGWIDADPVDLRGAQVSVYLCGHDLELDGARCLFWVQSGGTRWHLNSRPLTISIGGWAAEPERFTLINEESSWHRSWSNDPDQPMPLDRLLGVAESYGFSFTGFGAEVTGRLCMDEFTITR